METYREKMDTIRTELWLEWPGMGQGLRNAGEDEMWMGMGKWMGRWMHAGNGSWTNQ
jgi:hypothetical protein